IVLAFFIIQSCGGGSQVVGPTASQSMMGPYAQATGGSGGGDMSGTVSPMEMLGGFEPDGGWPDYDYDDGGEFWNGGAPQVLSGWNWNQGISQYRGQYGQRFQADCIPMGSEFAVWGSNPYTDDSPVCTAGAHRGLITRDGGGWVTVEIRPAQRGFDGSTA